LTWSHSHEVKMILSCTKNKNMTRVVHFGHKKYLQPQEGHPYLSILLGLQQLNQIISL